MDFMSIPSFFNYFNNNASDIPAPANYDGDGRTDAAVFRDGTWYLLQSTSDLKSIQFGVNNDIPIPSAFVP